MTTSPAASSFRSTLLLGAATAALLLAGPSRAHAQTLTVEGANSPYTFNASATYSLVYVGNTGTGVLNHSAGTLTDNTELYLALNSGANGTYNLSGTGALSASAEIVGNNGSGTFTHSAGTNTIGNDLTLGRNPTGSSGSYTLSGTGALSAVTEYIGYYGSGTFTQGGGTNTVSNSFTLGFYTGSGTYNLNGGTLTTPQTQVSRNANTSSFTQSGGTHTTGLLNLTGFDTASQGTYSLNGGTLVASSVNSGANGVRGTSTFNFNGGTLRARAGSATFFQNLTKANVQAGGAKTDTNGFDVTVAQALLHDTTANAPALDGGLTKLSNGTLTLSDANTYTGATTVSGGTLVVASGSRLGSGPVSVASGAALTVNAGGLVKLTGSASKLTVNGTLTNNGVIRLEGGSTLALGNRATFTNAGVLDVMGTGFTPPAGFTNSGVIYDPSVIKARSVSYSAAAQQFTVQIDGYPGHTYRLEKSASLTSGFASAGVPDQSVAENTATNPPPALTLLTFTDSNQSAGQGFYRVVVDP